MRSTIILFLILFLVLMFAEASVATDGVLEINQTCAISTGCFAGDGPGYPVTLGGEGSYRLTANLDVSDPNVDAIAVNGDGVEIDLNGFEISGPVSCTGLGSAVSCGAGTGMGVDAALKNRVDVRNGRIRRFGSNGINLGDGGAVLVNDWRPYRTILRCSRRRSMRSRAAAWL